MNPVLALTRLNDPGVHNIVDDDPSEMLYTEKTRVAVECDSSRPHNVAGLIGSKRTSTSVLTLTGWPAWTGG
jgi:hypothetical protein